MLTDPTTASGESDVTAAARQAGRSPSRALRIERALAFCAAAGLLLAYALRGGAYDIVAFEENGLVVWWLLALGLALGLWPRSRPSRGSLLLLAAFAAYAGWTALSLLWTDSAELTFEEVVRSLDYLGLMALLTAVVGRRNWRAAVAGLGFAALLVCVVAVGTRLAPRIFGHDPVDAALHVDRLSAPFGYWNAVAAWGAMCIALGVTWSAHESSRVGRAVALGLVPVAGATVYLTYSRAGAAGSALALIAGIGLSRNRMTAAIHAAVAAAGTALAIVAIRGSSQIAHATGTGGAGLVLGALVLAAVLCAGVSLLPTVGRVDRWRVPVPLARGAAAAAIVVLLAGGAVFGPRIASRAWKSFRAPVVAQRKSDPTARLSSLSGTRYPTWRAAVKAFDAHPLDGTGAGTFEFWWNRHGTDAEFLRDAHNVWLENLAELGLPGLLLIVAVVAVSLGVAVTVLRRVRRSRSAGPAAAVTAAFAVYLLHASVDWMWESTAVTVLAFAGVAIVGARMARGGLRLRLPGRAVLALLAAGVALLQLPGVLSTTAIRRSQTAERAGHADTALALATDAVRAEPWSASAYEQRGLVLESGGRLTAAASDLNRAISHEPDGYGHWLVLARIEAERGRVQAAVRDYDRARTLRPDASVFVLAPYFRMH